MAGWFNGKPVTMAKGATCPHCGSNEAKPLRKSEFIECGKCGHIRKKK